MLQGLKHKRLATSCCRVLYWQFSGSGFGVFSTRSLGPMYTQLEYLDLQHLDNHGCFNTTILAYRGGSLTCIADYVATYRTDRTRRISPPATHHPLPRLLHPPCPASSLFLTAQRSFGSGSGSTVFLREGGRCGISSTDSFFRWVGERVHVLVFVAVTFECGSCGVVPRL